MKVQQRHFILVILVTISLLLTIPASFVLPASAAAPTELFFSEYIEGSSYNKALEIYNGTGSTINLTAGSYDVQMFFNGSVSDLPPIFVPVVMLDLVH